MLDYKLCQILATHADVWSMIRDGVVLQNCFNILQENN